METFKVFFPAFCFILLAGCSAQEGLNNATCAALDVLIENRNTDRVGDCRRSMVCDNITCSIFGVGSIAISFTPCDTVRASTRITTLPWGYFYGIGGFDPSNFTLEISDTVPMSALL